MAQIYFRIEAIFTPMGFDIYALHDWYGYNSEYNAGDTTYNLSAGSFANNLNLTTIWDAGGTDLLDGSGYSTNITLDLTPMDDNPSSAFLNGAYAGPTSMTFLSHPTKIGDSTIYSVAMMPIFL